jgi:hypothetical protein
MKWESLLWCHAPWLWVWRGHFGSTLELGLLSSSKPCCQPSLCSWNYVGCQDSTDAKLVKYSFSARPCPLYRLRRLQKYQLYINRMEPVLVDTSLMDTKPPPSQFAIQFDPRNQEDTSWGQHFLNPMDFLIESFSCCHKNHGVNWDIEILILMIQMQRKQLSVILCLHLWCKMKHVASLLISCFGQFVTLLLANFFPLVSVLYIYFYLCKQRRLAGQKYIARFTDTCTYLVKLQDLCRCCAPFTQVRHQCTPTNILKNN